MNSFGDEAEIVGTVVCGDSFFNENLDSDQKGCIRSELNNLNQISLLQDQRLMQADMVLLAGKLLKQSCLNLVFQQ